MQHLTASGSHQDSAVRPRLFVLPVIESWWRGGALPSRSRTGDSNSRGAYVRDVAKRGAELAVFDFGHFNPICTVALELVE
jgi:hypothetical protein